MVFGLLFKYYVTDLLLHSITDAIFKTPTRVPLVVGHGELVAEHFFTVLALKLGPNIALASQMPDQVVPVFVGLGTVGTTVPAVLV